ncbi:MAG: DUF5706 domain-containing protein [Flavobacteriaceae bacterium]
METLVEKAAQYVTQLLREQLPKENTYHNLAHTHRVVGQVTELARLEDCSPTDKALLQLAAWFHDTGYIHSDENHEVRSAEIAQAYLQEQQLPQEQIDTVIRLIRVTQMAVQPTTLLEKIMKDADCGHVASYAYFDLSEALRQELVAKKGTDLTKKQWLEQNNDFFQNHTFYTPSAQEHWSAGKQHNQEVLAQKQQQQEAKLEKKKPASRKLGRGVETMFRVTLKNHIDLSSIADTKANILLSVNAIIISVALSNLVPKLDAPSNSFLIYPTLILMLFSVVSVVLSVLSTRPNVSNVSVTREMIKANKTNILFFGNFHKMSLEEFEWGMDYLIDNEETLYNSLTKDLYYLGLVLERKYRLLRITYTVFMIGIVVSALAFIISFYDSSHLN